MARKLLGMLLLGLVAVVVATTRVHADEKALTKELAELNQTTGLDTLTGALSGLVLDKERAQKLIEHALPLAKKKALTYNAALVLGLAAAERKEMKSAEIFFRVCIDEAIQLQSFTKLRQAYELPIELYFVQKEYASSARLCKELLELNTDGENPPLVLATMDTRGGVEFSEPTKGFDLTRRLREAVFETYVKATAKQGKFEQAIKMVDNKVKQKNDWIDLQIKGWVLKEANRLKEAALVYEDVIKQIAKDPRLEDEEKDPYIQRFRLDLSNVYVELKNIDRATEHLEYLIKKRPTDPMFYNDLGYIWADNDVRLEEAEKYIRKALELDRERRKKSKTFNPKEDQDSGAYLDSLGWVLFKQKNYKEAKEWLLKAIEDKSSQHIEIYDHLGDVYMALGERAEAIRAWQKGIDVVGDGKRDQERKVLVEKKLVKLKDSK